MYNSIFEAIENISEDANIAIVSHPSPDPDSIGSAMGIKWLLEKTGRKADIIYTGSISDPMNQAMSNLFTLPLDAVDSVDNYDYFILVDTTESNTGFDYFKENHANVVIDHHDVKVRNETHDFVYLEQCGACCSLVYNMIRQKYEFDSSADEDIAIQNCLLLGIKIDTDNMFSDKLGRVDFEAYQNLLPVADLQKIKSIVRYPKPRFLFELYADAVKSGEIVGSTYIAGLGIITPAKECALHTLSNEFLEMDGIDTTVVFAVVNGNLRASVRSKQTTRKMKDFCKTLFGEQDGGGKFGAGGATVSLGYLSPDGEPDDIQEVIYDALHRKVIRKVSKEVSGE